MREVQPPSESEMNLVQRVCAGDVLTRSAHHFPEKPAIVDGDTELTYAELNKRVNRVARTLLERGTQRHERVAIMSRNTWQFVVTYFACAKAGLIAVPMNVSLKPEEIAYILQDSGTRLVIAEGFFKETLASALESVPATEKVYLAETENLQGERFSSFEELLQCEGTDVEVAVQERDGAQLLYTSGTTAQPKGALTSHLAITITALTNALTMKLDNTSTMVCALPMFHVTGLNTLMLPHLLVGGTFVLLRGYEAETVVDAIEQHQATSVLLLPMMWQEVLALPNISRRDFSSMRRCIYAMAPMPPERLHQIREVFENADVVLGSGQTEFTPATVFQRPEHQFTKPGSWGPAVATTDVQIMDEAGNLLQRGETGEIVYRGPQSMNGYWNNPEANEEVFRHGWFHSGDVGWIDEEGVVWFVDREKDMIKTGGENVASIKVERALLGASGVQNAAVVGLPHERWGEAVTAFVTLASSAEVSLEQILDHCRGELAPFEVPKEVVFLDLFPTTATGKIQKNTLREQHQDQYQQQAQTPSSGTRGV